jgi:hypothetical protein
VKHSDLGASSDIVGLISSRTKWAGHVTCVKMRCTNSVLAGKAEEKTQLRRSKSRWDDNTKMAL